jgi:HD-like signal output (HDOD) protein
MLTASEIVAQTDRLPSLPAVYFRVKRVIDDPNGSIAQLAEAMATDAAMTARVLRVVNSPFFGFPGRIETVTRALNILGMQQVHDLVLAWALGSVFADVSTSVMSMQEFWYKSVARGLAARGLARLARFVDAERLFVEGLLSDIGHLVMYVAVPDLSMKAAKTSERTARPLHETERDLIGCDYAAVGAALVSAWGLPAAFEEPIACQTDPFVARRHPLEAAILHVAGIVVDTLHGAADLHPDPLALATLELDSDALGRLANTVELEVAGAVATLFPHLASA